MKYLNPNQWKKILLVSFYFLVIILFQIPEKYHSWIFIFGLFLQVLMSLYLIREIKELKFELHRRFGFGFYPSVIQIFIMLCGVLVIVAYLKSPDKYIGTQLESIFYGSNMIFIGIVGSFKYYMQFQKDQISIINKVYYLNSIQSIRFRKNKIEFTYHGWFNSIDFNKLNYTEKDKVVEIFKNIVSLKN